MIRTLLTVFAAAALMFAGCNRKQPSADYEQASRAFSKLYGEKLDDAFIDPRMDEIEAQLERVPADSLDAENAKDLLTRIREGRERMEVHLARQQEAVEAATAPLPYVESRPGPGLQERPPEPDAGTGPAHPVAGMPLSELTERFGGCFSSAGPGEIAQRGPRDTYELNPTDACKAAHPGFDQQFIVIEDGKILALAPKSSIQTRTVPVESTDAGAPPNDRPDAGR